MVEYKEISHDDRFRVRLKLALGAYEVKDGVTIVDGQIIIRPDDYFSLVEGEFWRHEPCSEELFSNLKKTDKETFMNYLCKYKSYGFCEGGNINDLFVKLYFPAYRELDGEDRGRHWVDYEGQLKKTEDVRTIFNDTGIWAMPIHMLKEAIRATRRYGDNIMIVKPVKDEKYVLCSKEIVGNSFIVFYKHSLHSEGTWKAIREFFPNALEEINKSKNVFENINVE